MEYFKLKSHLYLRVPTSRTLPASASRSRPTPVEREEQRAERIIGIVFVRGGGEKVNPFFFFFFFGSFALAGCAVPSRHPERRGKRVI